MAHTPDVKKKRCALELERLFCQICWIMRDGASIYKVNRDVKAFQRAIDRPRKIKLRIYNLVENLSDEYLEECFLLNGGVITWKDYKSTIDEMVAYRNELVELYETGKNTLEEIADLILLQVENEQPILAVPTPIGFKDWGE